MEGTPHKKIKVIGIGGGGINAVNRIIKERTADADFLCMLIPAGVLARQLTADGLSSYTGKELKKWADAYELEPLQTKVNAAR